MSVPSPIRARAAQASTRTSDRDDDVRGAEREPRCSARPWWSTSHGDSPSSASRSRRSRRRRGKPRHQPREPGGRSRHGGMGGARMVRNVAAGCISRDVTEREVQHDPLVIEGEDEAPRQPASPLDPYTPEPGPGRGERACLQGAASRLDRGRDRRRDRDLLRSALTGDERGAVGAVLRREDPHGTCRCGAVTAALKKPRALVVRKPPLITPGPAGPHLDAVASGRRHAAGPDPRARACRRSGPACAIGSGKASAASFARPATSEEAALEARCLRLVLDEVVDQHLDPRRLVARAGRTGRSARPAAAGVTPKAPVW